ncbi:MAG: alanine-zipper protein [Steroidobacteraceae bacterium]
MNKIVSNTLKAGAAALVLLTAAGCQTAAIDEVRAMATKAGQDAAAAQAAATSASTSAAGATTTANAAKSAADNAQSTANQALQAAKTAQAGVDATNEKMDRMFKQSVSK